MAFATDVTALRQAQGELERRVADRTAELAKANRLLQSEVDERKRSEAELLLSEEKFRDLAENLKEVFWLVDSTTYEVLYISPGYAKIWGRSCESLYRSPRSWLDSVHPEDRERVSKAYDQAKEGRFDREYRIILPDGRVRWIHDRAFPVRKGAGAVHRVAGIAEDITERKRLETEIREAIHQSRQAYKKLQDAQSQLVRSEKLASIGMLVSGVAHELNNPLNVIYGNLKLLKEKTRHKGKKSARAGGRARDPEEPSRTRLMLRDALRAAERAIDIIEAFRDFARDTRWAEPLDLNKLLEKTLAVMRRQLPPGITVAKRLGRIPKFRCFPGQVTQVFFNLIQNSVEAIEKKGRIVLRSSRKKGHILIEVEDTGKGMPPEVKERIFEPFFTTKEVGKGLGLGLCVSAMIVHNHGGEIDVESGIGKGSVFRIRFPLTRQDPSVPGPR